MAISGMPVIGRHTKLGHGHLLSVWKAGATHKCDQQVRLTSAINRCDSQVRSTGATHKYDRLIREFKSLQVCKFASLQV